MAKYKSILKNISIKKAGKKRKCYHNKNHVINMGEFVLEVKEGMKSPNGYCFECAKCMIRECKELIASLEKEF